MPKLVPNCIGRLDAVVDLIRTEEYIQAGVLLSQEVERMEELVSRSHQEYLKQRQRLVEASTFAARFIGSHEFRQQCTLEVGG